MAIIALLIVGAVIYLISVCFALSRGCDVKTALKIPFIVAFTFETSGNRKGK